MDNSTAGLENADKIATALDQVFPLDLTGLIIKSASSQDLYQIQENPL